MLRCTGCGSTETIEQIRAQHPNALSCCPERRMVNVCEACEALELRVQRLEAAVRELNPDLEI